MHSYIMVELLYLWYSSCLSLQKMHAAFRASRNFEDNSCVGLVQRKEYIAHE